MEQQTVKSMTNEQLIGACVWLDREQKKSRAMMNSYKAELQARGLAIMEDHNVKYVKFYGDEGSAAITDSMSLDILNPDKLKEFVGEGVYKMKVKEETKTTYKFDSKFEKAMKAIFTGDYTFETTLEEFLDEMSIKPDDKQKNAAGKALIRYFCVPCKPSRANGGRTRNLPHHDSDKWKLFKEYNRQDVVTEMEIERRLSAFPVPEWVQHQWEVDLMINSRGVAVDIDLVRGALDVGARVKRDFTAEAVAVSGIRNPNSVKQLAEWLNAEMDDEEIKDLRKGTVSRLLAKEGNSAEVQRMLEIRQELSKTSTKKYDAIEACVCGDGRVRGLLQFYGANRTGRWAGRLVQVQNLPRTYTKAIEVARKLVEQKNADALRVLYGSVPDTLSQLIRTAFIAPEGHVLIDADFSAIEARVISWLAGEEWRLEVFRSHGKIYEASASQMFGVPIERIKKGNPEYALRAKGKVAELALGYQGSAGALINMGALDMGLTEDELPDIVERWREANSKIRDLWYAMDAAAVQVIQCGGTARVRNVVFAREYDVVQGVSCMTITLPSGRKLYYINPSLGTNQWG